jgi:hypothetical protein
VQPWCRSPPAPSEAFPKRVLQSAVLIFLAGSALCGQAQSMTELIAFRAVQGLGAGGLIVLIQSVIGDIVPPRERGRYQGLFERLLDARRELLAEALADDSARRDPAVSELLQRLARELSGEPPVSRGVA